MNSQDVVANPGRVLVTFATRYGSTQEVAETISNTLQEHGFSVDVRSAREIQDLKGYSAVVLGAPFYLGSWHKDAQRFVARFERTLADLPLAIFALGPVGNGEEEVAAAREQLTGELDKHPLLKPVATELFGGKYDPAKLSIAHRLLTALPASPLHGLSASDLRDWDAIRDWATHLASAFQPAVPR